jgi:hypothetical protein
MFAMARYATIASFDNSDATRSAWVDAGCALPRHELKMAFARPLSLNARLRKSRDCERNIITQQQLRVWLNLEELSWRGKNCERSSTSEGFA